MDRRRFMRLGLAAATPLLLVPAACTAAAPAPGTTLPPTPECADDDVTTALPEGPFFKPDSPQRTSLLEPGMAGTKLLLTGVVVGTSCRPIPRALLDFWQADINGKYDGVGSRLRGHQFTDDQGRYTLETIVPSPYFDRTRHIHVKAQAADQPILTTQLYFPNEPINAADQLFREELLIDVQDVADGQTGTFTFVLAT